MEVIRRYLFSLAAAALLCAMVRALVPKGRMEGICSLFCGVFLAMTALSSLAGWSLPDFAAQLTKIQMQAEQARTGVEIRNREALCAIIKEKTEAYILDKAQELGLEIRAEVTVETKDGYPYPSGVSLSGPCTADQRHTLTKYIEENLAIGEERQYWTNE